MCRKLYEKLYRRIFFNFNSCVSCKVNISSRFASRDHCATDSFGLIIFFFGLVFQLARGQRKEVSETETSFVGNINSEQALKIKSLPMSLTDRNSLLCVT